MLDNDIYVNHTSLGITTKEGMIKYLEDTLSFSGKTIQDAMLVLCAYSFYLTNEEVSLIFPIFPAFTHLSTRVFAPLVEKGFLAVEKANTRDEMEGTAKLFYHVTAQGYQQANSLCKGQLTSRYKKNRSKVAKSHTYYIGYNFIQLLMLGFPMTWQREHLLGQYNYYNRTSALQVDGYCQLYESVGQKPFFDVYVEQDLRTEHNDILVGKLQNYANYGLMDYPQSSMIIFSMSPRNVTYGVNGPHTTVHPYGEKKCASLIKYMDEMYLDDLYKAYATGYPDQNFIISLMLKVGAAKGSIETGIKKGNVDVNKDFIKEFKEMVYQNRNPYAMKDLNIIRSICARERLEEMVKLLYRNLGSNEIFLARIRRGYQICYYPTTLVADRIKYAILSKFRDQQKALEDSLLYFINPHFDKELTEAIFLTKGLKLNLRNHFTSNKADIYVEFLSSDVGAWIRSTQFIKMTTDKRRKVLVLVFETRQQLADFYRANDCYTENFDTEKGGILSLMLYDIGKSDKLFYVSDESLKRHYLMQRES